MGVAWMNEPVDPRTTWERRIEAERERREAAQAHFDEVNRRNRKWRRVKFALRVASLPVVLPYAFARLGWEWVSRG